MFQEYEIFALVIEAGSLSAAARELGLTPPMVSKRLARLEDRLGRRLIERTTRRLAPTEAGRQFYQRVRAILDSVVDAEALVSGRKASAHGLLRVSAPTSFGRLHLASHLKAFADQNPQVQLELNLTDEFVDLTAEDVDVAVRITAVDTGDAAARRLAPNRRVLCAAPAYLDAAREPTSLAELKNHRLIAASNQCVWRLEGPDGPVSLRIRSCIRTNSSEVAREAILSGMGLGVRSTWDVGKALASGDLKVVLPQYRGASDVGIYAMFAPRRAGSRAAQAFVDFLGALYGPVPYWDRDLDAASA
jgi:DNA-binding transcriptional LysR family regulator